MKRFESNSVTVKRYSSVVISLRTLGWMKRVLMAVTLSGVVHGGSSEMTTEGRSKAL